jgi:transcriptional regulator GlxA family with amidase domain
LRDVISETEAWEEIAVEIAVRARELAGTSTQSPENSAAAEARVTRIIRMLEERPQFRYGLSALAEAARLSRYHFLRVFQQLTGVTPHQYVLRMRLRNAATQLLCTPAAILEIALDCGFGDISNFNHAFRAEFGMRPSAYRKKGNWCIAP